MEVINHLNKLKIDMNKLTYSENNLINLEIDELQRKIDETINNIENINIDKKKYILEKKKNNAIMKLFMPYIIAMDMTIDDTNNIFNDKGEFDKMFIKNILEKYIR